ncbi:hypothetical protein BD410DRAFT_842756 [Rickenella mellea]|uniref:Uncharacterized protein n=1 Tax=Rickenella mellea TaxID=50990 RepID=A0A4Y7PU73_9AGAM|nr:hypothetical protein BD410DRAFT_842756 [Rickenella mellea]
MFFDGIAFTLILTKAILAGRSAKANILRVLIRDGAIYYAVLFILSVGNLLLASVLSQQRAIYVTSLSHATVDAQAIGGSHIILNLRKYASRLEGHVSSLPISGMQFPERRSIVDEFTRQIVSDFPINSDVEEWGEE